MKKPFYRQRLPWIVLILIIAGAAVRMGFPPSGNLSGKLAEGNYSAADLFQEFTADPPGAYIRLANKVVIIEGEITGTGNGYVVLGKDMCLVKCMLRKTVFHSMPVLKTGDRIIFKGICRGLNLTEVLVTNCILINKT